MRILAICADPGIPLDGAKGASVHLLELWRALARAGADIDGVAPWRGGAVPETRDARLTLSPIRAEGGQDEILHRSLEAQALALAEKPGAAPDGVWERLSLGSEVGLEVSRRVGAPLVVEVNAPLSEEAARFRHRPITAEIERRQRNVLSGAERVYCVSRSLVPYTTAAGADPLRIRVLANGVDVVAFAPPDLTAAHERVRVGFVGSFKEWHGCDLLLDALAQAVDAGGDLELDLLGEGPMVDSLKSRAAELGIGSRVRFLGARSHAEVPAFLHSVDIAVAPAPAGLEYYFSPLKVYEYMAAGRAVIAPRAGQPAERLEHGRDAWLVPPGDVNALAAALVRLASDPERRQALGEAARRRAREEFDWSRVAARILDWFGELVPGRRTPALE